MTRAARALFVAAIARIAFGAAFLAAMAGRLPIVGYLPLQRRWTFDPPPGALVMRWYGATIDASLAAIACALIAIVLGRTRATTVSERTTRAVVHAAAFAMALDFLYFGWVMTHQTPAPLPLPAWYCPR